MEAKVFWGDTNISNPALDRLLQVAVFIFSVTRRSRSDVSESVSDWWLADFNDVTLASDDTYKEDEEDEEEEEDEEDEEDGDV